MSTLSKGQRLQVTKNGKTFIGTISAIFQDYYIVKNRRGGSNFVYEGEYQTI